VRRIGHLGTSFRARYARSDAVFNGRHESSIVGARDRRKRRARGRTSWAGTADSRDPHGASRGVRGGAGCLASAGHAARSERAHNTYAWQLGAISLPTVRGPFQVVWGWGRRPQRTARWRRCRRSRGSAVYIGSSAWRVGSIAMAAPRRRGGVVSVVALRVLQGRHGRVRAGATSRIAAMTGGARGRGGGERAWWREDDPPRPRGFARGYCVGRQA